MFGLIEIYIGGDCDLTMWEVHKDAGKGKFRAFGYALEHGGKSLSLGEREPEERDISSAIIIPCDISAVRRIRDFIDMQKLHVPPDKDYDSAGPYYFSQDMSIEIEFEKASKASSFGGPFTAYANSMHRFDKGAEKDYRENGYLPYTNNPRKIPFARYNCWTLCQGVTQYVAELDLSDIHPNLPYFYRADSMENWISEFYNAGEQLLGRDKYTRKMIEHGILFARQKDGPPFFITDTPYKNMQEFLEMPCRIEGKKKSIAKHLFERAEKGALFTPRPITQHRHVLSDWDGPGLNAEGYLSHL